jgi:hypothetical protein
VNPSDASSPCKSELRVESNLMLDDERHHPHYREMPGDLLGFIYKEFVNPESIHHWLTPKQQREYLRYLPCLLCGRPCAGTCK